MSNFWEDKWAQAKDNWEELRSKVDTSDEVLAGIKETPGGIGRKAPSEIVGLLDKGFNIGRSIDLVITATGLTQRVSLVDLDSDDEGARSIAVTLFAEVQVGEPTDLVAEVEWGAGGVQAQALVDFANGTVITVHGSFLRINASMRGSVDEAAKVAAFASYGYRSGGLYPQRTVIRDIADTFIGNLAPGATSDFIDIPRFANAVQLAQTSVDLGPPIISNEQPYALIFFRPGGGSLAVYTYNSATGGVEQHKTGLPAMFPNAATLMQIRNLDTVNTLGDARLIFNLSL